MYKEIGSYDAKTRLPEILRLVEKGESFTITLRGKAIADLIPSHSASREKAKAAVNNILNMEKTPVDDDGLRELIEAGRK